MVEVQVQTEDAAHLVPNRRRHSEYANNDLIIEAENFQATQQTLVTKNEDMRKRLGEIEESDAEKREQQVITGTLRSLDVSA
tara:strand:+ start:11694 stop:11939 length:246 start_codon:yes stop_codon:yes gene_type:complete